MRRFRAALPAIREQARQNSEPLAPWFLKPPPEGKGEPIGSTVTIDRLKDAVSQQPFRPFVTHTADGRSYRVPHPDFVSFHPKSERICIVWDPERVDSYRMVDLLLVASLDFPGQEPGSDNGASRNGA